MPKNKPAATSKRENRKETSLLLNIANEIAAAGNREELAARLRQDFIQLFHGDFITIWLSGEKTQISAKEKLPPANFFGASISRSAIPVAMLSGEAPIPDTLYNDLLAKEEPVPIRFSTVEKMTGKTAYSDFWKRRKITWMLAGRLMANNKVVGALCIYYTTETDVLAERVSLLASYLGLIATAISNILSLERSQRLRQETDQETSLHHRKPSISGMIGDSQEMLDIQRLINQVAPSDATVLLTGETGTGKELAAEAIHLESHRKDRIMVKLNCAAMPASLIESELFGHEKGSFTGALSRRIGKFELAHGSTILLDEVGEIPLETQAKLLRVLQEREIERIGGSKRIKVDVRVIAATNRNLEKEVAAGRFRSDLYYRLNVFPLSLPPLRQRKEDIPALATYFVGIYAGRTGKKPLEVSVKAMQHLMDYSFPGNIRELEHIVQRTVLLTSGKSIRKFHLPEGYEAEPATFRNFVIRPLHEIEREYIIKAIKACGGRISGPLGAAVKLGLPATTLISRMERLGIKKRYDHRAE